ncbi:MAG: hypothetical protein SGPRY_008518, partial [Prymnesium sp.]
GSLRLRSSFEADDAVQHRAARKSAEAAAKCFKGKHLKSFGSFCTLPHTEQEELDSFRASRQKSNSELELESLVKQFALALSFFDRYKLDWLCEQIEMRVIGLSWIEFKTNCSTHMQLHAVDHLKQILDEEQEREIPTAEPAPLMQRKTFKQLNPRLELRSAAQRERAPLESIGELDIIGDRQTTKPPTINDSLVGRQLEVRWSIRKSKRSKDSLPAKALRFMWPADEAFNEQESYSWVILNPDDWNKEAHLEWRWAECELRRRQNAYTSADV